MQGNEMGKAMGSEVECLRVVAFMLGAEEFAININQIQEIIRMGEITWIPKCPKFIKGVINLRGNLALIIHLRERLGLDKVEPKKENRIIVVEHEDIIAGFIVDSILESKSIPISCIEPPPTLVSGIESEYIVGVAKLEERLLMLLDIEKILSLQDKEVSAV